MTPTTPPNDDPLLLAITESWPRLPAGIKEAICVLAVHSADKSGEPARRTRYRHYDDQQIQALRAKVAQVVIESPTQTNSMIAQRIGLARSTFKYLHLHHFVRKVLAGMAVAPHSASQGYNGQRADEPQTGEDSDD